jgi:acid phosphatase
VRAILLGSAVPKHLIGTTDNSFYNHFTSISTVSANWGLHTLGRYDVGANVLSFVAKKTHDVVRVPQNPPLLNLSYPGVFNSRTKAPLPIPNTKLVVNGRTVLPEIVATWGAPSLQKCTLYADAVDVPDGNHPPVLPAGC